MLVQTGVNIERIHRRADNHLSKAAPYLAAHRAQAHHYRTGKLAYSRVTQNEDGTESNNVSGEACDPEDPSCVTIVCTVDEVTGEEVCKG